MSKARVRAALVLIALVLCSLPVQAAPRPLPIEKPGFFAAAADLLGVWSAVLVSLWERAGSEVDPWGNHGTSAPPPEGSGSDPWGNHGTAPPEGSGSDPWGGS